MADVDPALEQQVFYVPQVLSVLCALVSVWRSWVLIPGRSGGEYLPLGQGSRATKLVFLTTDEMTFG